MDQGVIIKDIHALKDPRKARDLCKILSSIPQGLIPHRSTTA